MSYRSRMMRQGAAAVAALCLLPSVAVTSASAQITGGCPGGFDLVKAKSSAQKQVDKAGNRDKHVCLGPSGQIKDNDK